MVAVTSRREGQSGLVLVDKPPGPSSFAVVKGLRRRFGTKAGHAGTLDPLASGLLVCLLGRATRLVRYLVGLDKRYVTEIELGLRTTTGDAEGEPLEATEVPPLGALEALRGEIELPVPAASAVKVRGERAYRLHRRGAAVEMPTRRSAVHDLRVLRYEPPLLELELHVSSGTYVRSIADRLGGHCCSLRRTAVGPFRVEEADETRVRPPLEAVSFLPSRPVSGDEADRLRSGRPLPGRGEGPVALVLGRELVAVGRAEGGRVRPETVLS